MVVSLRVALQKLMSIFKVAPRSIPKIRYLLRCILYPILCHRPSRGSRLGTAASGVPLTVPYPFTTLAALASPGLCGRFGKQIVPDLIVRKLYFTSPQKVAVYDVRNYRVVATARGFKCLSIVKHEVPAFFLPLKKQTGMIRRT